MTTMQRAQRIELLLELHDKERRDMEASLHSFVRGAWPLIEPNREFVDNWHLHTICEHLEAVTKGDIKRLLINVPFRTSKSTFTSVAWPAWTWTRNPGHQWLCGSYADKLSIRDSTKMRRLVTSDWYRAYWPDKVVIEHDQNEKKRFQNTANGYRIAFSMTGGVMGEGGDTVLIDDPHDKDSADSEIQRVDSLDTYDGGIVTRLNDPDTGAIVIIMQRLHEKDLSGHVMEEKGWTHLMLPMEYEPERHCTTSWPGYKFSDPRTKAGELLWPTRFSRVTVENLKIQLGEYQASGQLQQRPSPAGGGILQTGHFQLWPREATLPRFDYILQSYDTAYTDDTANDPTACTVWGVFKHTTGKGTDKEKTRACAMLLDSWADFMKYPALKKRVMDDWKALYGGDDNDPTNKPRRADGIIIEDKGSGKSVQQDLREAGLPVMVYDPGHASKTARASLTAPMLEADTYYLIESRKEPGKPMKWARPLVKECEQFPNGEHDDLVDTFTQSSIYLQRAGWLELPVVTEEAPSEVDYHAAKAKKVNPYGA
jgi:predicted phage terminase large subunit-like protein